MRAALLAGLGLAVVLAVGCTSDEHPGAAPPATAGLQDTATDRLPTGVTTALQTILDGVVADHALTGPRRRSSRPTAPGPAPRAPTVWGRGLSRGR